MKYNGNPGMYGTISVHVRAVPIEFTDESSAGKSMQGIGTVRVCTEL